MKKQSDEYKIKKIAAKILEETPLIDGHNDFLWRFRKNFNNNFNNFDIAKNQNNNSYEILTDIPRLRLGKIGGQFFAIFIPENYNESDRIQTVVEQIDLFQKMIKKYSNTFEFALTSDDIIRIHSLGKIASLLGLEGGHCINNSLSALRIFHICGVRYLTLAYLRSNSYIDSATDKPLHNGISESGRELVKEMNNIGMMIDLSHASFKAAHDVLDITKLPVIFSHSSAYKICPHPRNVPDDILKHLPQNGGIVMISFVGEFTSHALCIYKSLREAELHRLKYLYPDNEAKIKDEMEKWKKKNLLPQPTIFEVADHIEHICQAAGIDHVGIGSDFDGFDIVPKGLEDVSCYPALIEELIKRGFSKEEVKKISGLNILRVMKKHEAL